MSVILTGMEMPENCIHCPKRKVIYFPSDDTGYYKDHYQLCPMNEDGYLTESWFNTKKLESEPNFKSEHCPLKSTDELIKRLNAEYERNVKKLHWLEAIGFGKAIEIVKEYFEAGDTDGNS